MSAARYVGFLNELSGYGAAARNHLQALDRIGYPVSARSVRLTRYGVVEARPDRHLFPTASRLSRREHDYDSVLVHAPPPQFWSLREQDRRHIGISVWETETLPWPFRTALAAVDEIWVPSGFSAHAFRAVTQRPVIVVRHPVEPPGDGPRAIPDVPDHVFLFVAICEWSDRKNPEGLVRAFLRAFAGRKDVALFLKAGLGFTRRRERVVKRVRRLASHVPTWRRPPITLCFDRLSPRALARLYRRCDAFVSLHRAEGFGLCIAEAMAAGKPAIATSYSGNLEFMDGDCSFLVDCRPVRAVERVAKGAHFERSMWWAEPNIDAAVDAMRTCAFEPARRQRIAEAGREKVAALLSMEAVGQVMRQRLED